MLSGFQIYLNETKHVYLGKVPMETCLIFSSNLQFCKAQMGYYLVLTLKLPLPLTDAGPHGVWSNVNKCLWL